MTQKSPDPAERRAYAAELKKQIQALGGLVGSQPGFEENNPEFMIEFYEGVLAEEKRISRRRPSIGVN